MQPILLFLRLPPFFYPNIPLLLLKPNLPIKHLTQVEFQDKGQSVICYNYNDKWSLDHRCKQKFLLLFIDEEEILFDLVTPIENLL